MSVPVLVVPGQPDDMIIGFNAIKHVMQHVKNSKWFWDSLRKPAGEGPEELLLGMLADGTVTQS